MSEQRRRRLQGLTVAGVVAVSALAGCRSDPPPSCTDAGCSSRVVVDLRGVPGGFDHQASVCIDGRCTNPTFVAGASVGGTFPDGWVSQGKGTLSGPAPDSHATSVRITVTNGAGDVIVDDAITAQLSQFSPNGPGCPPTCWYVLIGYDPSTGELVERPR